MDSEIIEDTYELTVMRAELLGLNPPDKDKYDALKKQKDEKLQEEREQAENEEIETANLQQSEKQNEQFKHLSGGLDALTNILSITQTKLNKFKTVSGSIKNLFKIRDEATTASSAASDSDGECSTSAEIKNGDGTQNDTKLNTTSSTTSSSTQAKKDFNSCVSSHVDKLDALLMKTENAQLSMQAQNKQMRSLLR